MLRLSRATSVSAVSLAVLLAGAWLGAEDRVVMTLTEDFELHGDGGGGGPGAPGDLLGWSVAVDGDTAIVGAPGNREFGEIGLVYVFVRSGGAWVKQQSLVPADVAHAHVFGRSVALSGNTAVVGDPYGYQLASGAGAVHVFVREGEEWTEQQKLVAADGAGADHFGRAVAVSGDLVVVGAPNDDDAGESSGSAYVFSRSGGVWSQRAKLTATDPGEWELFGEAVAVSGDTALVGARLDGEPGASTGAAYVFGEDGGGWVQEQKLSPSDAGPGYEVGWSVALDGETALVGALGGGTTVSGSGAAYVFVRSGGTWNQQAKLEASDAEAEDGFGQSVSLSVDRAAVGSWRAFSDNPGAAYVFDRSGGTWSEQAKLVVEGSIPDDKLGSSVSLSGDIVVIGAPFANAAGKWSGAGYAFVSSGGPWTLERELLGEATAASDFFGLSLAVSDGTILVGAPHDGGGYESSVYVFERSGPGFEVRQKLLSPDVGEYDWFGQQVAVLGNLAVVGAPLDSDGWTQPGAAYVFVRAGDIWTQQQKLRASAPQEYAVFGVAVALSADTVLVTAQEPDSSGAVYVFESVGGTWTETQRLLAPQPVADDYFGSPCAFEGDTILVGATGDDESATDAGAVYVFERHGGTWIEVQKLMASDAAAGDQLGWPALSGDTALVGANGADGGAGAVYVFEREGGVWIERGRLTPEDPEADSYFGTVSVAGDVAVIGAHRARCGGVRSGAAYLFQRSGGEWRQRWKLCPSDPIDLQVFGFPTALAGGEALVGAPFDDDDGWRSGSVYRFSVPLFADGFESGDTAAWSGVASSRSPLGR